MKLNIALTYNLIHEEYLIDKPIDAMAEFDSMDAINRIISALESGGHRVIPIEADENAYQSFVKHKNEIDYVFNLAEGIRGEARESQIPCILEMLNIPYVGSGPLTLAISLNKYRAKEIFSFHNIPTPNFQVFHSDTEKLNPDLKYPLIAKLSAEGSSMGLGYDSIVNNEVDLKKKIIFLLEQYHEPVLVEEFIGGREFTIPIIGNDPPTTLPIIEVLFFGEQPINLFLPEIELPIFEKRNFISPTQKTKSICPANISNDLQMKLQSLALKVFKVMECRDWCRLEIRLDEKENPYVLELNPIAGIAPDFWFPRSAEAAGIDYNSLLNKILNITIERYNK